MKFLLAASTPGIHQCLSRRLPWTGDELVSSVCVLKQARGTLILPNQEHCRHIPSVISCLLFYALQEDLELAVLAGHAGLSGSYACRVGFSCAATLLWFQSINTGWWFCLRLNVRLRHDHAHGAQSLGEDKMQVSVCKMRFYCCHFLSYKEPDWLFGLAFCLGFFSYVWRTGSTSVLALCAWILRF